MQPHLSPQPSTRSITVLGSTGSVGVNTLRLLYHHRDRFRVEALTAYENVALLAEQAINIGARRAVIGNTAHYRELKSALSGTSVEAAAGNEAIIEAARIQSDLVIAAVVGAAGLLPTLAAIARGAMVGIANKECLVCAGDLMMQEVKRRGATLIPVDSEHSAIFQAFDFEYPETVEKIVVTASGGPFRKHTLAQMRHVTPQEAVRHPNWNMGAKISVDSATMMNKGLEIIEAYHLFPVTEQQIEVIVHPESIIHGMVAYRDGSVIAQMGQPDMSTPIAHALAWPGRIEVPASRLNLMELKTLTFESPDLERFPALRLARDALKAGGNAPVILNAANEVAVSRFLNREISFLDIVVVIEKTLSHIPQQTINEVEDVLECDRQAREIAKNY